MSKNFKCVDTNETYEDILVSFHSKWLEHFLSKKISYVFRKRIPITFKPNKLFIYLTNPHKMVIGYSKIKYVFYANKAEGYNYLEKACLDSEEYRKYVDVNDEIGVYEVEHIKIAKKHLTLNYIRKTFLKFAPPQSFVKISKEATDFLMKAQ